jgi:AcrR family transcriptional regulator
VPAVTELPSIPERRRRSPGEERRLAILAAVEDLLRERPLSRISIGDIAGAAGVTRSGFYFYFASKGAAVSALLGDVFADMIDGAAEFIHGTGDPRAGMRTVLAGTWSLWHAHEALIIAMIDARGTDAAVRELWEAWIERFVEPLAAGIELQRSTGRARPGPDPRDLIRVLLGANVATYERLSRTDPAPADVERALDALAAVWAGAVYGGAAA